MDITISLRRDYLRAALITAAKYDIREYLNGVCVEVHTTCAYLCGTNGHMQTVLRDVCGANKFAGEGVEFIIPRKLVEKVKLNRREPEILVTYNPDTGRVDFDVGGALAAGDVLPYRFPDWRRVIPARPNGDCAQFDADYIALLAEVAKTLGRSGKDIALAHNGQFGALVSLHGVPDYLGVLMPNRADPEFSPWLPMLARPPQPVKAKEKAACPATS